MRLIIDLDGTICSEEKQFSRALAKPLLNSVETINSLKDQGHTIIIYSSRTWAEYEVTEAWLKENGYKYDQLVLGKPQGDFWIDDRAIRFLNWSQVKKDLE